MLNVGDLLGLFFGTLILLNLWIEYILQMTKTYNFTLRRTENGFLYKANKIGPLLYILNRLVKKEKKLRIDIKLSNRFDNYPYMDTFKFLDREREF
jgi:hypothetical protein